MVSALASNLLWTAYAHVYNAGVSGYNPYLEMMDTATQWVMNNNPTTLVDLGCGTGNLVTRLRDQGWKGHYLGLDATPPMIEQARKRNPAERFVLGRFEDLPTLVEPGSVETVISLNALYVLTQADSIQATIKNIAEALVQGGQFAFALLHEIDPENMIRAHLGLPALAERKNDLATAVKLGWAADPLMTLRLFFPGVFTKLLGSASSELLSSADWQKFISAQLAITQETPYYMGPNYQDDGAKAPGTIFFGEKKPA